MKRMRLLIAMLMIWLFTFYNIERWSGRINISGIAYIFAPVIVVVTMLIPRLRKVPVWIVLAAAASIFLVLKALEGSRVWGAALPLTITEVGVIAVTVVLARGVSDGVKEFERAVDRITIGGIGGTAEPFSIGQGEIYREVRRARKHQRPLMLMAIKVDEESIRVALDRMVQEAQQAMVKHYTLSGVSRIICDELDDYNIVAKSDDHFLVLLPETTPDNLPDLIERLRNLVSERLGVSLEFGTASLPDDAATLESLIERAVERMNGKSGLFLPTEQLMTRQAVYDGAVREETDGIPYH